jgi:ParB-like chromosome segregation protein Spo0J
MSRSRKALGNLAAELEDLGTPSPTRPAVGDGTPVFPLLHAHPAVRPEGAQVAPDRHAFILNPSVVHKEGPYVREFVDDDEFRLLVAAVQEAGARMSKPGLIFTPLLVRTVGTGPTTRYVLVDGMRRIHAAWHLGLTEVPAQSLGDLTVAQVRAIQQMANDVRKGNHVVDAALNLLTLQEEEPTLTVQQLGVVAGASRGKAMEYLRFARFLRMMPAPLLTEARKSRTVTWRGLREMLKNRHDMTTDTFARELRDLIAQSDPEATAEIEVNAVQRRGPGGHLVSATVRRPKTVKRGRPNTYVIDVSDPATSPTSFAARVAWRDRHVERAPEDFANAVGDFLHRVAVDAVARYVASTGRSPVADAEDHAMTTVLLLAARPPFTEDGTASPSSDVVRLTPQHADAGRSIGVRSSVHRGEVSADDIGT